MRSDISRTSNLSTNAQIDVKIEQLKSLGCDLQTNHRHQDLKRNRYHRNFQLKIGHQNDQNFDFCEGISKNSLLLNQTKFRGEQNFS